MDWGGPPHCCWPNGATAFSPPGAYSASKHAMEGLSNALRHELYPFRVKTILIEPGYIVTNIQQTAVELAQPYQEKIQKGAYAKVYRGCWAGANRSRAKSKTTPEDCARVILRAIEAPKPKARYAVTPLTTAIQWAKRLLPDSALDALIRRRYGVKREE